MSGTRELTRAKQEAELARRQLLSTVSELQQRLKPTNIASNAWEGVTDKAGEFADDAVQAVKTRPVAVSAALGAFTLFLARAPIRAAMSRLFARKPDEDLVTTRLDGTDSNYDLTAPLAARRTDEGE
jgi:ElaB/YqjD/DUF883 family membrane-anchored ribosome-binding protein